MQKFSLPQSPKIVKKEGHLAVIEVDSLYPGYGTTLGNALRRVLLSSIPGSAITTVKIAGADHEFSTLPNVMEDVIHILLNLKQVRFKLYKDEAVSIKLSAKGEKKVTAADFETAAGEVEIVNPDAYIATLTDKKAVLAIEAEISPGVGYEPVERRRKDKIAIGSIALDAIYTPIRKVKFSAENMRVGDRTDFNKLVFEIETDGSIRPEEAFKKAVDILDDHIKILGSIEIPAEEEKPVKKVRKSKKSE
ncbi:MAG: DNA-directed RNA polymerase subunit alpha [Parcubacteria group bacterium]|nr:DNA-directed RNA polymerase subunit alpha [Parcubacteria group bacterium]